MSLPKKSSLSSPPPPENIKSQCLDLDSILTQLTSIRGSKPGKLINLAQDQIFSLIKLAREKIMKQPMLLEIHSPVKVCGDIHGQYYDLLRIFQLCGYPPQSTYVFLGDYVDRGRQGIQTICLLLALKVKYPKKIYILRGNHESASINRIYGFYEECKKRYSLKLWKAFVDCFNWLPISALIQNKILCMHGGLSPELTSLSQINSIVRPTDVPDSGIICDLLWSDPDKQLKLWGESDRGISYHFGYEVVKQFQIKNGLDLVCRAHQVVEDGYQFFGKKHLVTVFSAPNYCGEFNNCGAIMNVQEDLTCSFTVLKPADRTGAFGHPRPNTPPKRT